MKVQLGLILAGLVWLAGCATKPPDVMTTFDPITGVRTDTMSENMLETTQNPPREVVWLNASRVFKNYRNKDYTYYLEAAYKSKEETGYLNIPAGNTLTIIADGQEFRFNSNGSYNTRKPNKGVEGIKFVNESALYPTTREQLQKIADAKAVKVRIKGDNGLVERDFVPENFKRFREFLFNTRS
ncbi:MAG: hypothetical protein JWM16_556 [Verrucomicrobiales bacterium]|nr:hypothetical protein [Verrucomicrobiales bacterium]